MALKMARLLHQGMSSWRNILTGGCPSHHQIGIARGASYHRRHESKKRHEEINEGEEVNDFFNQSGQLYVEDYISEEVKRQKKVKFKIIEKKYFKEKAEENLLTWDAKEQIRYLHQEYPEEWTIGRLAESFPISSAGVKRLLKSTWCPMTLAELVKHDDRVQKQWKQLKSGSDGGPVLTRYQKLLTDGKLQNAAGVAALPAPARRRLLLDGSTPMSRAHGTAPGAFEQIVSEYCEKKQEEKERDEQQLEVVHQKLFKLKENSLRILCDVTKSIHAQSLNPSLGEHRANDRLGPAKLKASKETNLQQSMLDAVPSSESLTSGQGSAILEGLEEIPGPSRDAPVVTSDTNQPPRKALRRNALSVSGMLSENLQLYETGKLPQPGDHPDVSSEGTRGGSVLGKWDDTESILSQSTTPRTSRKLQYPEGKESHMWEELRYDTQGGYTDEPEAYLYSEQQGYQHPLGKKDRELDKLEIPPEQKAPGGLYQKGNAFYDEDGHLLYRIS